MGLFLILFFLIINVLGITVIPIVLPNSNYAKFYTSDEWIKIVFPSILLLSTLTSLFVCEKIKINDCVIFLSTSVNRHQYLLAKIFVTITINLIIYALFILPFVIILSIFGKEWLAFGAVHGNNFYIMLLAIFMVILFCTMTSMLFKFYLKFIVIFILLLFIVILYVVGFPIIKPIDDNSGKPNVFNITLFCNIVPNAIFGGMTLLLTPIGYIGFSRWNVRGQ
ncbi:MAG: hypothetical protein LBT17_01815 [Mycoplasmataceae bacterium]|nr:hypothetical protein [Mycoplasmataceae bacterium]